MFLSDGSASLVKCDPQMTVRQMAQSSLKLSIILVLMDEQMKLFSPNHHRYRDHSWKRIAWRAIVQ